MKTFQTSDQRSIIHLSLIIGVLVLAAIGFVGYQVLKSGKSSNSQQPAAQSQSVDSLQNDNAQIGNQINNSSVSQNDATAQADNVNVPPPR